MEKVLIIEFNRDWVFKHRNDDVLPVELVINEILKLGSFKVKASSYTDLQLVSNDEGLTENALKEKITEILKDKYPEEEVAQVVTVGTEDEAEEPEKEPEEEKSEKPKVSIGFSERTSKKTVKKPDASAVLKEIDALVGCEEFKALANEIYTVAPLIKGGALKEVFANRCYIFSIGDGCGFTTYMELLAKLISACGILSMDDDPVAEDSLGPYKDSVEPFLDAVKIVNRGDSDSVRVFCIDISEWMEKTDDKNFKNFLRFIEKSSDEFIYVFRVPFVDKDVLARLRYSLNDVLSVKSVSIPPLSNEELKECAVKEIEKYGFTVAPDAWAYFTQRISEEKSDGKFYGLNTVKKVVAELIYEKQLANAKKKKPSKKITATDMKALCANALETELTGAEQLERLVGNEQMKQKIKEIVAQIEMSVKDKSVGSPCIHMRFVGNPGTGKTTVARIVGKILKEKGVLRIGNFYEHSGRDLCGRYVGETAPKTAGFCRDAYGSVLFLDEAYSLYRGEGNADYGREALDTLIAEMENHRNDFVLIMAGYTDDMEKLMQGNAGLASRMPYTIEFPNFTREQLYEIFVSFVKSKFGYEAGLFDAAHKFFMSLPDSLINSKEFSNARYVRNLYERTWAKACMRCQLNANKEVVLTKDDFELASSEKDFAFNNEKKTKIGF